MEGYDVVTTEDEKVGTIVGSTSSGHLVIEQGTLRKSRRVLPQTFAHVDDGERIVRVTVSKQLLAEAPEEDAAERDVATYYDLAGGESEPATQGEGYLVAGDPAETAEQERQRLGQDSPEAERAEVRSGLEPGQGRLDEPGAGSGLHVGG